jgi:hypothetical protein
MIIMLLIRLWAGEREMMIITEQHVKTIRKRRTELRDSKINGTYEIWINKCRCPKEFL